MGSGCCAEQLQSCAPHLSPHYYHNLWWERNRSSIRSVGKVTTPKTPVRLFRQRARRGQLACLVCLCALSLITASQPLSFPDHTPPSRPVAFAPHLTTVQRPRSAWPTPQPLHPPAPSHLRSTFSRSHPSPHLHPDTLLPSPGIPPAVSPLSTCCPGDSIAAETTLQLRTVAGHMCMNVCVGVAEVRVEAKITDNPREHWSGHDTMEATQGPTWSRRRGPRAARHHVSALWYKYKKHYPRRRYISPLWCL